MNKKGFIKILEAVIAILIIAGVLSFVYVQKIQKPNTEEERHNLVRLALEEIANDEALREVILNHIIDSGTLEPLIKERIDSILPEEYEFSFKICPLNMICVPEGAPVDKEVYSEEASISSTQLSGIDYRKIAISIWEK